MANALQAGHESRNPVLFISDSAGFPFWASPDPGIHLISLDQTEIREVEASGSDRLVVFSDPDTAMTHAMCNPDSMATRCLVLLDGWEGVDHALRSFSLAFLDHVLRATGYEKPGYLTTEPDAAGLATESPLPVHVEAPPAGPRDLCPSSEPALLLCLSGQPEQDTAAWDWATRELPDALTLRVLMDADTDGQSFTRGGTPVHKLIWDPRLVNWLVGRSDLVCFVGQGAARTALVQRTREQAVPVFDVTRPVERVGVEKILRGQTDQGAAKSVTAGASPTVPISTWLNDCHRLCFAGADV